MPALGSPSENVGLTGRRIVRSGLKDSDLYQILITGRCLRKPPLMMVWDPTQPCSWGRYTRSPSPCGMWLNGIVRAIVVDAVPELDRICDVAQAIYCHRRAETTVLLFVSRTHHIPTCLRISPEYCWNGIRSPVHVLAFWTPCGTAWKVAVARQRRHRAEITVAGSRKSHTKA